MKNLRKFNLKNKRVLVRCDFNVPLSDKGEILNDFRIKESVKTIEFLIKKGAKIILISHLGRPQAIKNKKPDSKTKSFVPDRAHKYGAWLNMKSYSLKPISVRLEKLLGKKIFFLNDCIGKSVKKEVEKMKPRDIILLENVRFYKEEEKGSLIFARKLAGLGDVYVNDAFSVSHRSHSSIAKIPKFLPSAPGFSLEKEIKILSQVMQNPRRPLVAIIGGVKIETKIKLIERFLKKADHLLLGSKPAQTILSVKGILINNNFSEKKEILDKIKKIKITHLKLHLPIDGQMAVSKMKRKSFRIGALGTLKKEEDVFDIGPETKKVFVKIIKQAKTIIWNGPMGMFEKDPFGKGTKEIAEAIVKNKSAFKIAGGGDTIAVISKLNLMGKFDHVSTGGGAMLELLSGDKLPGIEVLK